MKDIYRKLILKHFDGDGSISREDLAFDVGISESELIDIYFSPDFQEAFRSGMNYLLMAECVPQAIRLIKAALDDDDKAIVSALKLIKEGKYYDHKSLDSAQTENNLLRMIEEGGVVLDPTLVPDEDLLDLFPKDRAIELLKNATNAKRKKKTG